VISCKTHRLVACQRHSGAAIHLNQDERCTARSTKAEIAESEYCSRSSNAYD
jgi:hypothetical protein